MPRGAPAPLTEALPGEVADLAVNQHRRAPVSDRSAVHRGASAGVPRATLVFLAAFMAYWPSAVACDALGGGLPVQYIIGGLTWVFLALAVWKAPRPLRLAALAMVLVATGFEYLGSLLWGIYHYRYHNLPLYVPPGHGLFYLAALRLGTLPLLRRHGRAIVTATALFSAVWTLHGLVAARPDLVGALGWVLLAGFLRWGRDPLLFALTFGLAMALEVYGTALGLWHWAAVVPATGLTAGNPPSAIGAGYCILDALALIVAHRLGSAYSRLGDARTRASAAADPGADVRGEPGRPRGDRCPHRVPAQAIRRPGRRGGVPIGEMTVPARAEAALTDAAHLLGIDY